MIPTTWKAIIDDLFNHGFISDDDVIIKDFELTYSDYFNPQYIDQNIEFVLKTYGLDLNLYEFKEALLKGNLYFEEGDYFENGDLVYIPA